MVDDGDQFGGTLQRIGGLVRDARKHHRWTQNQLADAVGTSQSAINRIEKGNQNLSLEMLSRISGALNSEIVSLGRSGPMHLRVVGGRRLSGSISVKTSKNAGVALLCAALLNSGRTVLRKVARIEEVNRILEVLTSIGVRTRWLNADNDLELITAERLDLSGMDVAAARRTRSIIMFLGPLLHTHALRGRLRAGDAHGRAAPDGVAPVRAGSEGDRRELSRHSGPFGGAAAADRVDRAR
jgi:UDP-N-acetylglucosamine 1-carboxyvinyltransferase